MTQRRRHRRSWGKIRQLRHGSRRYHASYMYAMTRHNAPTTFTSRMDAEHWLSEERRLIEQGRWSPPALRAAANQQRGKPFGEYALSWLDTRNLKPRTRQGYTELINGPLDKLAKLPLASITTETVRVWHTGLGTSTPRKNSHAYGLLSAIMNTAVGDSLIDANPCRIRNAMNTPTKRQPVILTPKEVAKVAVEMPARLRAFVLVSAWCGLRYGEMIELRRGDVDGDVITVSRGATHRDGKCFIETPKNGEVHQVIVPPHILGELTDHLTHHVGPEADSLLFVPAQACHYSDKTFRFYFNRALKAVGITKAVRIHDLRHFAGSQAARVGNLTETMSRLGHNSPGASLRYQHSTSGRDRAIAAALSALALAEAEMPENTG